MTTNAATGSKSFAHPPLVRRLGIASIALCTIGSLFVVSLLLLRPDDDNRLLVLSGLLVFGGSLYVSVGIVRRSHDTIVVDDDGLWCRSPNRPVEFLAWNDVGDVETQNVMQRLVIRDAAGERRIELEYHLQDFGELRRIVLERTKRPDSAR